MIHAVISVLLCLTTATPGDKEKSLVFANDDASFILNQMDELFNVRINMECADGASAVSADDTRWSGRFTARTPEEMLTKVTDDTPYTWEKKGGSFAIRPRRDSVLAGMISVAYPGGTLKEALKAILHARPDETSHPIEFGDVCLRTGVSSPDPEPETIPVPAFQFTGISATEALCRLVEMAGPKVYWLLSMRGPEGKRYLHARNQQRKRHCVDKNCLLSWTGTKDLPELDSVNAGNLDKMSVEIPPGEDPQRYGKFEFAFLWLSYADASADRVLRNDDPTVAFLMEQYKSGGRLPAGVTEESRRGKLRMDRGEPARRLRDQLLKAYGDVLELMPEHPKSPEVLFKMAELWANPHVMPVETQKAIDALKCIIHGFPEDVASSLRARFRIGDMYLDSGDITRAREYLDYVIAYRAQDNLDEQSRKEMESLRKAARSIRK